MTVVVTPPPSLRAANRGSRSAAAALLLALLAGLPAAGQTPAAAATTPEQGTEAAAAAGLREEPAPEPYDYLDELERDTPRGTMAGFLAAARRDEWEEAARYLDLSALPAGEREAAGAELALRLKRVLDRSLRIDLGGLSDDPGGDLSEVSVPPDHERVGVAELPDGERVEILLERVREEGEPVWKFAAETVRRIPELYEVFGYGPLEDWLPAPFFELDLFSIPLWQWIGLALVVVAAWGVSWLLSRMALAIIRPLVRRSVNELDDHLIENGAPPLHFLLGLGVFTLGILALRLAVPVEHFLVQMVQALVAFAIVWLAFRLVDIASHWSRDRLTERGQLAAISMLPLARKGVKVFLAALGLLAVLQNVGINVTALIAGLGVGGLAIALAAQKTIENLFGGMTLVVDQPVRVGDFCRFGDQVGTVEAVGLRSTRIRTLDRTLITIPNSQFSEMQLETFAARDRIRLLHKLGLRYETTPDQLRYVLIELRRLLHAHPRVLEDPSRVRLVGFGASSLDVEVYAYVETSDFNEFLAVQEDLLLRIADVVEAAGTGFAFPSQTLYLGRDGGVDDERSRAAEARVEAWRKEGALPLPNPSREQIDAVEGSLDYPPEGSAERAAGRRGEAG